MAGTISGIIYSRCTLSFSLAHVQGGFYDLCYSQPAGGKQDALTSLLGDDNIFQYPIGLHEVVVGCKGPLTYGGHSKNRGRDKREVL